MNNKDITYEYNLRVCIPIENDKLYGEYDIYLYETDTGYIIGGIKCDSEEIISVGDGYLIMSTEKMKVLFDDFENEYRERKIDSLIDEEI